MGWPKKLYCTRPRRHRGVGLAVHGRVHDHPHVLRAGPADRPGALDVATDGVGQPGEVGSREGDPSRLQRLGGELGRDDLVVPCAQGTAGARVGTRVDGSGHELRSSPVMGLVRPSEPAAQEVEQHAGLGGRQADEGVLEHARGAFDHQGLVELAHPIGDLDPRRPGIGWVLHEPHEAAGLEPQGDLLDVLTGAPVLLGGFTERGAVPGERIGQDRQEQPLAGGEPEVGELTVGPAGQVLHEHEQRPEGLRPSGQELVVGHIRKVLRIDLPVKSAIDDGMVTDQPP